MKSNYSELYKHFIDGLRTQRKARGITQTQLARLISDGQSFISKIERGERRLDVAEFVEISRAIGADPVQLFGKLVESFSKTPTLNHRRIRVSRKS